MEEEGKLGGQMLKDYDLLYCPIHVVDLRVQPRKRRRSRRYDDDVVSIVFQRGEEEFSKLTY